MSEDGGDDSPPRPKRKIKKVMILSSASESDSDESVGVTGTRKKRLRVISDEEASDSSGSSVLGAIVRRRRTLPKLRDSDGESDNSGWATDSSSHAKPTAANAKTPSGFASDSSEGNSDKCSICLLRFTNQETGTPESCEHIFCLDCITEWSKNVNTCPVDRMTFNSIVVRACAGGRVLRTETVKVVERRPSVDILVVEDPTVCEVCGSIENEESMLLCDGCDLGYHMQCLTPPLREVPINQWLCPDCDNLLEVIHFSEVEDLFSGIEDLEMPTGPRPAPLRLPRNTRRTPRRSSRADQPSTSSGRRGSSHNVDDIPTTSRRSRSTRNPNTQAPRRRTATTRRKHRRRTTKTVVIEYELEENGKFPVTRTVKRKLRKRKTKKRQPRTAARRSHVRASVRAKLVSLKTEQNLDIAQLCNASVGTQNLAVQRHRAGIPSLSLLGNPHQLEYFSDEEQDVSEGATTAVATRSTSSILNSYRQMRRKIVAIPSPPHGSSAPDLLSNIMESQSLLHAKNSLVSISVDGNINIKLQTRVQNKQKESEKKKEEKVDLSKGEECIKKVPTYPGQSRGGGGWGGGYRGNYGRDQGSSNNFGRGGYDGGGYQGRPGSNAYNNSFQNSSHSNNSARRDDDYYDDFPRRPQQFPADDSYFDRPRRAAPVDRGPNFPNYQRSTEQNQGRYSLGSTWQPFNSGRGSGARPDLPPGQHRHSFGGFEDPVDMRMSQVPPMSSNMPADSFPAMETPRQEKPQAHTLPPLLEPHPYQPLPQPPVFHFQKITEVDKSEDEKSDSGLVIDTEKYDPTEPTLDDEDSGADERAASGPALPDAGPSPADSPSPPPAPALAPPPVPLELQNILAGLDTSSMNVPSNILDNAVRQVLKEHRDLISSPNVEARNDKSDEDSDGDCPNFSIYSATSVHIANNTGSIPDEFSNEQMEDNLEDLVQEDDDIPMPEITSNIFPDVVTAKMDKKNDSPKIIKSNSNIDNDQKKKTEDEYKEKVSKRCPITTNTRNPIKIKLNTPSLIKRQVTLYDEEETSQDGEAVEKPESSDVNDVQAKGDQNKSREKLPEAEENDDVQAQARTDKENLKSDVEATPVLESTRQIASAKSIVDKSYDDAFEEDDDKNSDNELDKSTCSARTPEDDRHDHKASTDDEIDDITNHELRSNSESPKYDAESDKIIENVQKMTESISETEDERSYTPCLDENKSTKDASFEIEKDKGLEGLDTEMISEDEGNEMFSENERAPSEASRASPAGAAPAESEEGEIPEKKKEAKKTEAREEVGKKKKKKDSKKEGKDKNKGKKKGEISFKKLSKSGKERNYRERDKDDKKGDKERKGSAEARQRKRKEKRKDLERYDVRTVVTEKRRKLKDPFGRDVSPRARSPSLSRSPSELRTPPALARASSRALSPSRPRRSPSASRLRRSPSRPRRSPSRPRRSPSRPRRSPSRTRKSPSRARKSLSRARRSPSKTRPMRARRSLSRARRSLSRVRRSLSRTRRSHSRVRRSLSRPRRSPSATRRSPAPTPRVRRKRRRSASGSPPRRTKKKKTRRALRRRSGSPPAVRPASPRTPPSPGPAREPTPVRRRDADRPRRRARDALPPSKEVFTSGDNILVSVSFKETERGAEASRRKRREGREGRRTRRRGLRPAEPARPVAIIDLERSPFRELTPEPPNVIVLSDSDHDKDAPAAPPPPAAPAEPPPGPKTPPEPHVEPEPEPAPAAPAPSEPRSPDAYDPFEPTRSPSPCAPEPPPPSPPRTLLTLEAAQRSNLSADDVLGRPLSPAEKVMALLASTRGASPEPAPAPEHAPAPAPAPRIVLPEPSRAAPKLFPGKPSPIKSNPVKPMQARPAPLPGAGASPYSPGSSDFGELFSPPRRRPAAKAPVRMRRRKANKTQVGIKIDDENLRILDELPSSAVALQVKNKFLKKLNRQERVVEEVKHVLKPHYNKKKVTKDEYKEILRRAVPKICHNKTGEINPMKIQALVEAYVKKFRKKHKLGIV